MCLVAEVIVEVIEIGHSGHGRLPPHLHHLSLLKQTIKYKKVRWGETNDEILTVLCESN